MGVSCIYSHKSKTMHISGIKTFLHVKSNSEDDGAGNHYVAFTRMTMIWVTSFTLDYVFYIVLVSSTHTVFFC